MQTLAFVTLFLWLCSYAYRRVSPPRNDYARPLCKAFTSDEIEFIQQQQFPVRILISSLGQRLDDSAVIRQKDIKLYQKDMLILKMKLAQANTKYLKMAQNLNLRKVIEDLSSKKVVKETRKLLKSQRNATVASGNPSNQELWSAVFKMEESKDVFPNLHALINEDVPVASIMADLIRFASKEVHTGEVDRVFIDSRSLTSEQVNILSTITVLTSKIQLMF
jgi:hypothetical protein